MLMIARRTLSKELHSQYPSRQKREKHFVDFYTEIVELDSSLARTTKLPKGNNFLNSHCSKT